MKHHKTALACLVAGLVLTGCGNDEQQQAQPAPAPTPQQQAPIDFKTTTSSTSATDLNERLLEAIRKGRTEGGLLLSTPATLFLSVVKGQNAAETLRLTNTGDEDLIVQNIVATTQQNGLNLGGTCSAGTTIKVGAACDLVVTYQDTTGRSLDTNLLITTNSKRSAQLTINLQIDVIQPAALPEPEPSPAPVAATPAAPAPTRPQGPTYDQARVAAMQQAAQNRARSGFGRAGNSLGGQNTFAGNAKIVMREREKRYDPETWPSTESSLPVDRARILTADRVIKAVIETPILAGLCQQVVATIEGDVYSPDSRNILIPGGSRALGKCTEGMDERQDIIWQRILTPTGVSIVFRDKPRTGDAQGMAGVPGIVRENFSDQYIMPLVTTTINALGAVATALYGEGSTTVSNSSGSLGSTSSTTEVTTPKDKALEQVNGPVRETINKYIEDNRDLRRLRIVPGGTRIDIMLSEDIYFKNPYEVVRLADFEYEIARPSSLPVIQERLPPGYAMDPSFGLPRGSSAGPLVTIDGRSYRLMPADGGALGTQGGDPSGLGGSQGAPGGQGGQYGSPYAPQSSYGNGSSSYMNNGNSNATGDASGSTSDLDKLQPYYGAYKPYGPIDPPPGRAAYAAEMVRANEGRK